MALQAPVATFLVLIFTLLSAMPIAAQSTPQGYYHWVDENGRMHFSQTPPLDAPPVSFIPARKKNFSDNPYSENQTEAVETFDDIFDEDFDDELSPKNQASSKTDKDKGSKYQGAMEILPQKSEETCKAAQYNLQQLSPQSGGKVRVRISTPSGEPRLLREDEIQAQRDKANRLIDLHC